MATLYFTGFESGDTNEAEANGGTQSAQTTTKRSGAYALKCNPGIAGTGFVTLTTVGANANLAGFNTATAYYCFYLYIVTAPAALDEEIFVARNSTPADKFSVRLNSSRQLVAYDTTPTAVATGGTALSLNTWYRIEVKVPTSTSTTAWQILIDGATELDGASFGAISTTALNNQRFRLGKPTDRNAQAYEIYFDDVIASDSAYPGAQQTVVLIPTANGSTMQWTAGTNASNYLEVDELPQDTATYVKDTAASDVALFAMQDSSVQSISGTINSVKGMVAVRDDGAAAANTFLVRIRSNTTNSDSTTSNNGTAFVNRFRLLDADPATGSAWTTGGIDATEVGGQETSATIERMTMAYLFVNYTPAAGGTANSSHMMMMGMGM